MNNSIVFENILKNLNSLDDVINLIFKTNLNYVKMLSTKIAKKMIEIYKIDYKDPNNFIYLMNDVSIDKCKIKNDFDYKKIMRLYLNYYNKDEIDCDRNFISSIPIYPNVKKLYCGFGQLKQLHENPNLEVLSCNNNLLTSLPKYPKLIYLDCANNELTSLPEYPNLENLSCSDNKLTSLPKYPKLIHVGMHS